MERTMISTFRATYANGVLTPMEPLDLKDGAEVTVFIEEEKASVKAGRAEDGAAETVQQHGETIPELFERLRKSVPDDAWEGLPTDLAKNKKHYLYGHPKEED